MTSSAEQQQQQQQQRRDWASTAGMDDYDPLDVDFDDGFDDGDSMVLAAGTVPPGSPVMTASSQLPPSESEDSSSSATAPAAAMPTSASAAAATTTVELPPERSERFLEFLADRARKRELCQGRTEYGHLCLQPAEENGYCRYHASQMQSSALVAWDERLFIVLDLDQTLVYTPTDGEEFPLNVRLNIQDITADGIPMKTAIRPFALEMLEQLDAMFTVYVVTGGTPSYCKAIVDLLNRLSRGAREVIKLGVSCRSSMVPVQAQPKTFHLVLPNPADHRLALAIDNCRKVCCCFYFSSPPPPLLGDDRKNSFLRCGGFQRCWPFRPPSPNDTNTVHGPT